ncbi:hypothetical protein ABKS89_21660 [Pseudomonas sp. LABIM340]|uniref:hypothetical protein n=1 Tax=Pseudomonas sp. LABIM340 TaxID=3156585 RepID=UPI0032AE9DFD
MKSRVIGVLLSGIACAQVAAADECDCSVEQGRCTASIQVSPTGTTKGLYGADLAISTSVSQCAKVEYHVDSTPYFTVLPRGAGEDRIQGTSAEPLSSQRVQVERCVVCATKGQKPNNQQSSDRGSSTAEDIFGNALDSDQQFDASAKDRRFEEIEANNPMPSSASLMGLTSSVQQIQSAVQVQEQQAAALSALKDAQRELEAARQRGPGSSQGTGKKLQGEESINYVQERKPCIRPSPEMNCGIP